METILGAAQLLLVGVGAYVFLIVVILAGAFMLAGWWLLAECVWRALVRHIRRWRVGQELERERDKRIQVVALTGTRGVPRRAWEAGEDYEPKDVA